MDEPEHDPVRRQLPELLPRLWRFAFVLSGSRQVAEDLVQSTCLRAIERRHQFRPESRLDAWTFTILSSIWKNQLRAEKIRRGEGLVDAAEVLTFDGARAVEANVFLREVLSKILSLPEAQRSAALLVYGDGLSYKEAAEVLDIPIGTVMSRLAAARKALARLAKEPADARKESRP